ncbi:MAG: hypothetical protein V1725_05555 [archaeon]
MAVIGFQFTKMSVERKNVPTGNININNNISIVEVKEEQVAMATNALRMTFAFSSRYDPDFGVIDLEGFLIYVPEGSSKDILKSWKKDKSLLKDVRKEVMNAALARCNVEAILMARELGLPSPVPMPTLEPKK